MLSRLARRLQMLFRGGRFHADLEEEMRLHRELREREKIAEGMEPEEAHYAVSRQFGNDLLLRERSRDMWGSRWVETFLQDLRYGLRQLCRNPGFTVVAVLTLALGIGANTAIFSLVNAVMLRNLPVGDPGRLVLFADNPGESMSMSDGIPTGRQRTFSYPFYQDVRDHSRLFEGVCAFQTPEDTLTVREEGGGSVGNVEVATGKMVSGNYFSVLGVRAVVGRALTPADDQAGGPPVAVVSFDYWQRKLAADPHVVGRTFQIDGVPMTVVGVGPRGFFGVRMRAHPADFWMPLSLRPRLPLTAMPQAKSLLTDSHTYWLNLMGRLKPGVTLAQARAEINSELRQYLTGQAGTKMTGANRKKIRHAYAELVPGGRGLSSLRSRYAQPLKILLVIVGLVLLIACANVANLMLARAAARQKEMAMRLALGGARGRLLRQILTESALLVVAGGVAGVLLAFWGAHLLVGMVAANVPLNVRPSLAVLGFTLGISALAVIFSGLAPALRAARVDLIPALKSASGAQAGQRRRLGLGRSLVVLQIAASLLLLVATGLLVHSLVDLENQNLGFRPQHVLLVSINPELAGYNPQQLPDLDRQLLDRIRALPGVRSASVGMTSPMSGSVSSFGVAVEGEPAPADDNTPQVVPAGPGYFETEGMRILEGRAFTARDTAASTEVAVVNRAFVRKFIPKGGPIGKRVSLGTPFKPPGAEIVGVVEDARYSSARRAAGPMLFLSAFQLRSLMATVNEIEVRASGDPAARTGEVRAAIREVAPHLPITYVTTLSSQVNDSLGQQRTISGLTGFFGILGLLLACVGLYGIMAYSVAGRTREIGIRMALGAEKGEVLRMILGQGLRLSLIGVAIGVAAALALTRFLTTLLYGVSPTDPLTFVLVSLTLMAVALLACYLPARRAAKVDPMVALRYE